MKNILKMLKAPKDATCFSCVHCEGGTFGPDIFSAKCLIGHKMGGCCQMVSKTCGFYEESEMVIRERKR